MQVVQVQGISKGPKAVLSAAASRLTQLQALRSNWDGQWLNWDDQGPTDPIPGGWGDAR